MKKSFIGMICLCVALACNKNDDNSNGNDLSKADRGFITQASYANNSEVAAGVMATAKASDTAVRSFGAFMVTEHTTAQSELKGLASKWSIETPLTPDSIHIAMMKQMQSLNGHAFDSAYMNSQVMDHNAAIQLFQQEATAGQNQKLKDYANKYLPHIMMHKQMADSIVMKLK